VIWKDSWRIRVVVDPCINLQMGSRDPDLLVEGQVD